MDNNEDLVEEDEHDMYLNQVPLEEEDRPRNSNIGEITFESNMDDQARITTCIILIVLVLYAIKLNWVSGTLIIIRCK